MSDLVERLNAALAGRYAIQRMLGRGGMATVFLADDLRHRRRVAIKVLHPELSSTLGSGRFLREIEVAARLHHPHILPLHDSGTAGDLLYYVMPFAEGESLRERLEREKQLPLPDALRIAREVADALDYAHRQGVVHRDIKPENVLLQERHALVADFGIARALAAAGDPHDRTTLGVVIGTPAYMSPEQTTGDRELDGRTDVYGLACVLFEMLAGQSPFTGPTESLVHQHLHVVPRPVTELRPAVPGGVARAIARALEKRPADRFSTAAEFAAALAESAEVPVQPAPSRPAPRRRAARALAAAAVVAAAIGIAAWQGWGPFPGAEGGRSAHAERKDWILVAAFESLPGDSILAATTRDLVSAALDQSDVLATVPEDQVRLALRRAGKPPDVRVDAALARELAYRSSVRTVLEGRIGRIGAGYSIVLRVADAESLVVVVTRSAVAKSEAELIPVLGRLARELRAGLGENRDAIRASRPIVDVATPSFPGYQRFVEAHRLILSGQNREAIPVLRDALALDPDFASAWHLLGVAFHNLSVTDSALVAYDEALRRPERLTPVQRLLVESQRADSDGNPAAAVTAIERAVEANPSSPGLLLEQGFLLGGLGRFEEGLESTRRAIRASPFGASPLLHMNEIGYLCHLGRVDEARAVAASVEVPKNQILFVRLTVEVQAANWAVVEHVADSLLAIPGTEGDMRGDLLLSLASAQAVRGAWGAATRTYARVEDVAQDTSAPDLYRNTARRSRLALAAVSEGAVRIPEDTWSEERGTGTQLTRALRAAMAGDSTLARRLLADSTPRTRGERAWQGGTPDLIAAYVDGTAGRWTDAARILEPVAAQPIEFGTRVPFRADMSPLRWCLADAFERSGRPDSAIATLERITSDPVPVLIESHLHGVFLPFAHRRLAVLHARRGRIQEAERHWRAFLSFARTPDPEVEPLIAEARAALASAHQLAESTGR